jgi:hypothetical protein
MWGQIQIALSKRPVFIIESPKIGILLFKFNLMCKLFHTPGSLLTAGPFNFPPPATSKLAARKRGWCRRGPRGIFKLFPKMGYT